jgi:hypothetical protein
MKTVIMMLLLLSTTAFADDVLLFKGGLSFNHKKHQVKNGGVCTACHEQEPGKIAGFGKEWAHKTCIECHDTFGEGPVKCNGCHATPADKAK